LFHDRVDVVVLVGGVCSDGDQTDVVNTSSGLAGGKASFASPGHGVLTEQTKNNPGEEDRWWWKNIRASRRPRARSS
jgi:hypothetical protein